MSRWSPLRKVCLLFEGRGSQFFTWQGHGMFRPQMIYSKANCAFGAALVLPILIVVSLPHSVDAQGQVNQNPPKTPAPVERLGPSILRVGNVRIDMDKKEISVRGVVTAATILEFVAVTKDGFKGYESALELDTNAINFNLALILIGLDQSRSVGPKAHLDPAIPQGDPLEIWVEWDESTGHKKVRAEQLIYNTQTKTTLSEGPWVYTGSVFSAETNAYLADVEGSLIGFVHTPAPIIDSPRPLAPRSYGNDVLNPALKLKAGVSVLLTVHALPLKK